MRRTLLVLLVAVACLPAAEDAPAADPGADPLATPHWPLGLRMPKELTDQWDQKSRRNLDKPGPHVQLWVPEGAQRIRAVMLIPNNTDSVRVGEHGRVRAVAAKWGMAIMHLAHVSGAVIERREPPTLADANIQYLLDAAAEKTGLAGFRHASFVTLGKSSRGRFPFRLTWWFPDRVIASISYHGEVPTWPMPDWSKVGDETVLHLNVQGLSEWDGTWYRHVRPSLLNYQRHTGWLGHQLVLYGIDHGAYYPDPAKDPNYGRGVGQQLVSGQRVWDYIAAFIDSAMELRVDPEAWPTDAPIALKQVDRAAGYCVHPRAPEELLGTKWFAFRKDAAGDYQTIKWPDEVTPVFAAEQGTIPFETLIKPARDIPEEERAGYLWIPDAKLVGMWLELHNLYKTRDRVLVGAGLAKPKPGKNR